MRVATGGTEEGSSPVDLWRGGGASQEPHLPAETGAASEPPGGQEMKLTAPVSLGQRQKPSCFLAPHPWTHPFPPFAHHPQNGLRCRACCKVAPRGNETASKTSHCKD